MGLLLAGLVDSIHDSPHGLPGPSNGLVHRGLARSIDGSLVIRRALPPLVLELVEQERILAYSLNGLDEVVHELQLRGTSTHSPRDR